jgi:hypothetical protein
VILAIISLKGKLAVMTVVERRAIVIVRFAIRMNMRSRRIRLVDMRCYKVFDQAVRRIGAAKRHRGVRSKKANNVKRREPDGGFQTESLGQTGEHSDQNSLRREATSLRGLPSTSI